MSRLSTFFVGLVALLSISAANAQFEVGGVTGGAPTAGVNCYGTAEGKILAYGNGWGAADCPTYQKVCQIQAWPCPAASTLCTDGTFCGSGGPHVTISDPSSTNNAVATATNVAPVMNAVSCANGSAGVAYTCVVSATDSNGDTLTYSSTNLPSWLTLNSATGTLTGTPNFSGAVASFDITVSDPYGGTDTETRQPFSMSNSAPSFISVTCPKATIGQAFTCNTGASDSDGHTLTYAKVEGPSWISVDSTTGVMSATSVASPTVGIKISASDGFDTTTSTTYNLALNNAPSYSGTLCTTNATQTNAYSCSAAATDTDGDSLTYTATGLPAWASLNVTTGAITGTPSLAGTHANIVVTANDGTANGASTAFSIVVDPNTDQKALNAYNNAVAGTLTAAEITALLADRSETSGVDLSEATNLAYVQSCIKDGGSSTQAAVAGCATGATDASAALWKVAQIAAGASGHPTSDLNTALLETAGGTSGGAARVGATVAQLRAAITTSGLTTSSSGTNIDDWITKAAGFPSATTYADVDSARTNGWTAANYLSAKTVSSSDWTNTAAHKTLFTECLGDFDPCTKTVAQWNSLKAVPTLAATSEQVVFSASTDVSYDISSLIGNVPNGYTITNLPSGWSASGGTITRTATIADATINFRVENANNSSKYVSGSFNVNLRSKTGTYKCKWLGYSGNGGLDSSKKIGEKCRQHYGSSYEAMLDSDRTDAQKRDLCDVHGQWTNWAAWGYTSPRHNSHYVHRQFHGNGNSAAHWHSYEWVCNGVGAQNGCGSYSSYVLCTQYD